jgi:hypothetical protein
VSSQRVALSLLILYHLVALGVNAIPPADQLRPFVPVSSLTPGQTAGSVALGLDAAARRVEEARIILFNLSSPLRTVTQPYINVGLQQKWNMFSSPDTDDHYVRLAYYATSRQGNQPRIVRELVFPADRDDQVRLLHDYRDKAVLDAHEDFSLARSKRPTATTTSSGLTPLVRYFRQRFAETGLRPGETIVRTEFWYGAAPMPPRGERLSDETIQARLDVLRSYYDSPVPAVLSDRELPTVSSREREADIVWRLELIDEH